MELGLDFSSHEELKVNSYNYKNGLEERTLNNDREIFVDHNKKSSGHLYSNILVGLLPLVGGVSLATICEYLVDTHNVTDFTKAGFTLFGTVIGVAAGFVGACEISEKAGSK